MRDREARGRIQLLKLEMHPAMLPELHVSGRGELLGAWYLGLRRLLLAMRVPPALLVPFAAVVPGYERAQKYYSFLLSYSTLGWGPQSRGPRYVATPATRHDHPHVPRHCQRR